jgi:kinesin family protein 11
MSERIKVVGRIRPLSKKEFSESEDIVLKQVESDKIIIETKSLCTISKTYRLDKVFNEKSSQEDVFNQVIPLLTDFIDGFNCSLFMYGQTGTGV